MVNVSDLSLGFGQRVLFKDVNLKFLPGNCYGLIGANGSGKSTFLKVLSGDIQQDKGEIHFDKGLRLAVLRQDQFAFDDYTVMDTVIMGHEKLYQISREKDELYSKPDFSEEDGIRAAELENEFAEMGGWEAEAEAAVLLAGLGISEDLFQTQMASLESGDKVRVLLAQALFGNPDVLLLDEPTNNLDLESITWLEEFLYQFKNTVIVVSHDRHFLNKVCTHIADIDFGKIQLYVGNYDFWYQSSQLAIRQRKDAGKRREDKIKELKAFIQRFSSNASKARQATSRKKELDKLTVDDIKPSSRKYPYVAFKPERECGKQVLQIKDLTLRCEDSALENFNLTVEKGDKITFIGPAPVKTLLFEALAGRIEAEKGEIDWGVTITASYFPKDNTEFFDSDLSLIDWLSQYSRDDDTSYVRGFLGRMLFSGDESLKKVNVLSGGERVRCMLARMMEEGGNVLIFDEPTAHLDLEAITSLNEGLMNYSEVILFSSHDHQFVNTIANRIIEITPEGLIDRRMNFDDYLQSEEIKTLRDSMYHGHKRLEL